MSNAYSGMKEKEKGSWQESSGIDQKKADAAQAGAQKAGEVPAWMKSAYSFITGGSKKEEPQKR